MGCGLLAKHAIDFAPNKLWGLLLVVGSYELSNELSGYMKGNCFTSLASRGFLGRSLLGGVSYTLTINKGTLRNSFDCMRSVCQTMLSLQIAVKTLIIL